MTTYIDGQASESLQRLQRVLARVTAQLFDWCRDHDLTMVLVAGSALGAERHGDFVPWDDDIDIGMTRADFDRFIDLFQTKPVPGMVLQSWQTEAEYPYSFAKVRLDADANLKYLWEAAGRTGEAGTLSAAKSAAEYALLLADRQLSLFEFDEPPPANGTNAAP